MHFIFTLLQLQVQRTFAFALISLLISFSLSFFFIVIGLVFKVILLPSAVLLTVFALRYRFPGVYYTILFLSISVRIFIISFCHFLLLLSSFSDLTVITLPRLLSPSLPSSSFFCFVFFDVCTVPISALALLAHARRRRWWFLLYLFNLFLLCSLCGLNVCVFVFVGMVFAALDS